MEHTSVLNGKMVLHRIVAEEGETIVEALISVLISALALLLMATAIGSSVNIVRSSRDHMEAYYSRESSMLASSGISGSEVKSSVGVGGTDVAVPIWKAASGYTNTIPVQSFSNSEDNIRLYKRGGTP